MRTEEAARSVSGLTYTPLPPEAVGVGKRCVIDGRGRILAGPFENYTRILRTFGKSTSKSGESGS